MYLASVKAAQQELDAAGATAPTSSSAAPASTWPGPSTGCSKMASMKAATEAALAAVGLTHAAQNGSSGAGHSTGAQTASAVAAHPVLIQEISQESSIGSMQDAEGGKGPEPTGIVAGSFDLGLINSWCSAAIKPASDGDGSSSPINGRDSAPVAEPTQASGGCSLTAAVALQQNHVMTGAAAAEDACLEDVVLQMPVQAASDEPATGLYDLD